MQPTGGAPPPRGGRGRSGALVRAVWAVGVGVVVVAGTWLWLGRQCQPADACDGLAGAVWLVPAGTFAAIATIPILRSQIGWLPDLGATPPPIPGHEALCPGEAVELAVPAWVHRPAPHHAELLVGTDLGRLLTVRWSQPPGADWDAAGALRTIGSRGGHRLVQLSWQRADHVVPRTWAGWLRADDADALSRWTAAHPTMADVLHELRIAEAADPYEAYEAWMDRAAAARDPATRQHAAAQAYELGRDLDSDARSRQYSDAALRLRGEEG